MFVPGEPPCFGAREPNGSNASFKRSMNGQKNTAANCRIEREEKEKEKRSIERKISENTLEHSKKFGVTKFWLDVCPKNKKATDCVLRVVHTLPHIIF